MGGGRGSSGHQSIEVDDNGNIYVTGSSGETWGRPIQEPHGEYDVSIAKLDANGNLAWNTFLGGSGIDDPTSIAIDGNGNIYLSGTSWEPWGNPARPFTNVSDAFAAKLDSSGNMLRNTFLGGIGQDQGSGITTDDSGKIYVVGSSEYVWGNLGGVYPSRNNAFIAKLDSSGGLRMNKFLEQDGSAYNEGKGIAIDSEGSAYVVGFSNGTWGNPVRAYSGHDAFVAKLDSSGNLVWNTFLGSLENDFGNSIALDEIGNVYITGLSLGTWGNPIRSASSADAFVVKLDCSVI